MKKGSKHSDFTRALIAAQRTGTNHSNDTKMKISETLHGRETSPSFKGMKHSEESKEKISVGVRQFYQERKKFNEENQGLPYFNILPE